MKNCLYQSDTKSYQPSRAEGLSSGIDSSNYIWSVRKADFTSNNRLHWNTAIIQQTPIWLSQKPLNCNYSLKIIWRHQNSYETKWAYNGCFYRLLKSFWYYRLFYLDTKNAFTKLFYELLYCVFNYLTHRQHFVQIHSNCSSLLTAKYGVPQGSIRGPILLNLCVADMSNIMPKL